MKSNLQPGLAPDFQTVARSFADLFAHENSMKNPAHSTFQSVPGGLNQL
jgi:hypothetical protein